MTETMTLYLPTVKREIIIELSIPKDTTQKWDTLYFLDGQNAFTDQHATYKRSIRAAKYLNYISKETNRPILGIGLYNALSDLGRISEYSPFKLTNLAYPSWKKQDLNWFQSFCKDFVSLIIPTIEARFNTSSHRFIYGSSLAALTAIYLGYRYNLFEGVGAFSTASFLCAKELEDFIRKEFKPTVKLFIYVGKNEVSDDLYDSAIYYQSAKRLYELVSKLGGKPRLVVSQKGTHCEASWEKQLPEFLSFLYFDMVSYIV